MTLFFHAPGFHDWSYMQEECCWVHRQCRWTPSLAIHVIRFLLSECGLKQAKIVRPDHQGDGLRAMLFTWQWGDLLEQDARRTDIVIANPSATAAEICRRFPDKIVYPSCQCFSTTDELPIELLEKWPHGFAASLYQVSSGCPHRCSYCAWDHRYRERDPQLCAEEVRRLVSLPCIKSPQPVFVLCNEITGKLTWLASVRTADRLADNKQRCSLRGLRPTPERRRVAQVCFCIVPVG